jgi:predicted O-linked N-acetylglucosamine transferase (SPINDLY family)
VIVWPARSLVSRAASGIARAAGVPWSIARTQRDYIDLALRFLAPSNRNAIRQRLSQGRQVSHPLAYTRGVGGVGGVGP